MALSEETRRHRLTIDWKSDGDGSIDAAFLQTASVVLRDGIVISRTVGPNQLVSVANGQPGVALSDILSDALTAALSKGDQMQAARDDLQRQLEVAAARIKELEALVAPPAPPADNGGA